MKRWMSVLVILFSGITWAQLPAPPGVRFVGIIPVPDLHRLPAPLAPLPTHAPRPILPEVRRSPHIVLPIPVIPSRTIYYHEPPTHNKVAKKYYKGQPPIKVHRKNNYYAPPKHKGEFRSVDIKRAKHTPPGHFRGKGPKPGKGPKR